LPLRRRQEDGPNGRANEGRVAGEQDNTCKKDSADQEQHKGDGLRLNPNNDIARFNLGLALGKKGGMDGKIVKERKRLRVNLIGVIPMQTSAGRLRRKWIGRGRRPKRTRPFL